jgi:type VI secretion system VasD/TssJ family lipoprotein
MKRGDNMNKSLKGSFLLGLFLLTCSCAARVVTNPVPEWRYEKEAIHLHLKADLRLNLYEGKPYTLVMYVYQLTTPNAFKELSRDKEGLAKLLESNRFDPSVADSQKLIIHPGQELTKRLDRVEGAQYVAIVAGYYDLQKDRVTRFFNIPVLEETTGVFKRIKTARPGTLLINLYLGPQGIRNMHGSHE